MYEDYFGFAEKPFSLTPDPRYLYRSECHRGALDIVRYAIGRREGLVVVTGDTGTGKTSLCRAVLEGLDRDTFPSLVLNPFLSSAELLRRLLLDFGLVSRADVRAGRLADIDEPQLMDVLRDFLVTLVPLRATALLVIDEAQNLPPATLEHVRMLSNLETDCDKLLQIVLVGDDELRHRLRQPALRRLDQRVAVRHRLAPLSRDELGGYVSHRLATAGAATMVAFTPRSLDAVHRISSGVPRVVNQVCDRALLGAYASRSNRVLPDMVQHAAGSLDLRDPETRLGYRLRQRSTMAAGAAAAALVMAVVGATTAYRPIVPDERWIGFGTDSVSMSGWNPDSMLPAGRSAASPPAAMHEPDATIVPEAADAVPRGPASDGPRRDATVREAAGPAPYSVLIGSYEGADESLATASQALEAQGYRVYEIELDLGAAGIRRQLLVGRYADVSTAIDDEARLRRDPRFGDARLVVSTTLPTGAP